MKVTLQPSTDAKILVWQDGGLVYASRAAGEGTQVCLPVDLFEVIADLAGLDLDREAQADEAVALADEAATDRARLIAALGADGLDARTAPDRWPGAAGSELLAHGRAGDRAQRRRARLGWC